VTLIEPIVCKRGAGNINHILEKRHSECFHSGSFRKNIYIGIER
jgi:hypothetical protein